MQKKKKKPGAGLFRELCQYEQNGVSIWLEGSKCSAGRVTDALKIREGITYMRDYVFSAGELQELRFNSVYPQKKQKRKP